jgi:transposase
MSLIHTAELNDQPPFDYLVALLRHPEEIAENPAEWMPWTCRETLARLRAQEKPSR